ncbi:MAG: beta strand repeat-containing protein, partial [Pirellulales bacterium]
AGLVAIQMDFVVDRGNGAEAPVVFTVYDKLGAAAGGGTAVSVETVPAITFPANSSNLVRIPFSVPVSLTSSYYSLGISTAASGTGNDTYGIRIGTLRLTNSVGATLSNLLYVEDSNTTGTAGLTLQAASGVLAQPVLSSTSVAFGNFRLGATLSQSVTLTNDNLATGNNYSEALAGSVTTATGGATLGGMPLVGSSLAQGANTSLTVGLPSATAGPVSGSLDLAFTSQQGTSVSPGPYGTAVGAPTISVSGTGYREAVASYSTTSPDLGKFHVGASNVSGSFALTNNATADAYSEGLAASESSATGGASVLSGLPSVAGPLAAGGQTNVTVQLASVAAVGANTGTVTLALDSSGTGTSGLAAASLGTQVFNVSAQGYSGQSIWQANSSGSWGSFDDWDVPGGTPGVDGSLSVNDTATFGSAASSATTVRLDGVSPTLATLTFSNSAASYTVSPGTGGSLTVGTSAATGAVNVTAGSHSIATGVALARDTSIDTSSGTALTLSGAVSGANALSKTGAGTLEITGTGTLSGATTVSDGTLRVNGSIASSDVTVQSGATIAGSGTVGSVTIASGGTLAPGNSPGNLTVNGDSVWSPGGNYNWQMYNVDGTAGTDWDLTTITGNLDLRNLTQASPYNINLWSLSGIGPDVSGNAINFNNAQYYSWTFAAVTGSISGFDADTFAINTSSTNGTSGYSNDLGGGTFSVEQSGSNLNLVFTPTPVPEPAALSLLAVAAAVGGARRARRWWAATAGVFPARWLS